jgi:non-haem dioxygenase in morphine synthesis N-terminal
MRFQSTQHGFIRSFISPKARRSEHHPIFNVRRIGVNAATRPLELAVGEDLFFNPPSKSTYGSTTVPPGHEAIVGNLKTFHLPDTVMDTPSNRELGKEMVNTWRKDGIFQISMTPNQDDVVEEAFMESKNFFKQPHEWKAGHVDSQSFAGYIASGEELTDGIADYSEIFTVIKDLPQSDWRVRAKWPCHGPCPWPNLAYRNSMEGLMDQLGENGEKLLKLTALGLGLGMETLTQLTDDGWHHMRVLRFVQSLACKFLVFKN